MHGRQQPDYHQVSEREPFPYEILRMAYGALPLEGSYECGELV